MLQQLGIPMAPLENQEETLFVHTQFLALARSLWLPSTTAVIGVSLVLAGIASGRVATSLLVFWLALVAVGQAIRVYILRSPAISSAKDDVRQRMSRYITLAPFCGLASAAYLFTFPHLSDSSRSVITLLFLGQLLGFISNGAGQRRLFFSYSLPILIPLAGSWMYFSGQDYSATTRFGVGALILLMATGILTGLASRVWNLFDESCRIRFREGALNARLVTALAAEEAANMGKTRFLAAASHDLRQPIHVIGMIGAALDLRPVDDVTRGMVKVLNQASTSMSSLLDSLLDLSKLDAGLVSVNLNPTSVADLMQQAFHEFAPMAEAKGLNALLEVRTQEMVNTDIVLMLRVMSNLTQNSIKFTKTGQIALSAYDDGDWVTIEISDTGCGISIENQASIFQEFFQVANRERNPSSGLGLGLSIVQRISKLLDISLKLESVLGQGTTVRLNLPVHVRLSEGAQINKPEISLVSQGIDGLKILLIDDRVDVLQSTAMWLAGQGGECVVAEGLSDALVKTLTWHPQVIVCDLRLSGGLNGIEVITQLRSTIGAVPALLLTGDTAPEQLQLANNAGIRVCHKPVSSARLLEELSALWITSDAAPPPPSTRQS